MLVYGKGVPSFRLCHLTGSIIDGLYTAVSHQNPYGEKAEKSNPMAKPMAYRVDTTTKISIPSRNTRNDIPTTFEVTTQW